MFVFDVSDTQPTEGAPPLPPEVENPFGTRGGMAGSKLELVFENAKRDGVRVTERQEGSQSAGSIGPVAEGARAFQKFQVGLDEQRKPVFVSIPVKYDLLLNANHSREARYATMIHELAHLYCGHVGTPNDQWWPDRRGLNYGIGEFEAESVAYLVCTRSGIDNPSAEYLAGYVEREKEVPPISLECVMKAAGLIETMSREPMKPRKAKKNETGE
jgi:hypothetical protein